MHSERSFSVAVTGLGGQGILLLSKVLASAAFMHFPHVCRAETRGLSQRGGSVQSTVRFGHRPVTAVIEPGTADLVISLELLESVRSLPLLNERGILVGNKNFTVPANLAASWIALPKEDSENEFKHTLMQEIESNVGAYCIDALAIANEIQCPKAANVVLLGAASPFLPIPHEHLTLAITQNVKTEFRSANALAFEAGRKEMLELMAARKCVTA